ncbi:unnamed protein product [Angiostrongylus costaricensis]|uniref:TNFR-Cys domain-containing protein n=1 Tax=Angiostrongylus costaricensis TaxID=334426 RepID=A0A158PE94_ANGCS|nr:unnamed protein product [Angiostrongylus costaricensis]
MTTVSYLSQLLQSHINPGGLWDTRKSSSIPCRNLFYKSRAQDLNQLRSKQIGNNVDRIRHDSVGEQSPKPVQREQRFLSPKLDPAEFLKMVSWQAPTQSEQRTSSTPASDIAETVRSWYNRQSRRRLFIALVILITVLLAIAIVITLVFLFAFQKDRHDHGFTPVTMMTAPSPTVTPFPYPPGYVVGTSSYYVPLGVVTSLVPDTRDFRFRNRLLSYGNDTMSLFNSTAVTSISFHLDSGSCSSCTLLAADDSCTNGIGHHCNRSQAIYCCSKCGSVANFCHVKGTVFEFSDDLLESRISSDARTLLITTASHTNSSLCMLQIHRIRVDGFTFSGPIEICAFSASESELSGGGTILTTTTFSPESANLADILTIVDSEGGVPGKGAPQDWSPSDYEEIMELEHPEYLSDMSFRPNSQLERIH